MILPKPDAIVLIYKLANGNKVSLSLDASMLNEFSMTYEPRNDEEEKRLVDLGLWRAR